MRPHGRAARRGIGWLVLGWLWLLAWPLAAGAQGEATITVYVRDGCPHCADAKAFLDGLAARRPALRVVYRDVVQKPAAARELEAVSRAAGVWPPGVPTFVVGHVAIVGFDDADNTPDGSSRRCSTAATSRAARCARAGSAPSMRARWDCRPSHSCSA